VPCRPRLDLAYAPETIAACAPRCFAARMRDRSVPRYCPTATTGIPWDVVARCGIRVRRPTQVSQTTTPQLPHPTHRVSRNCSMRFTRPPCRNRDIRVPRRHFMVDNSRYRCVASTSAGTPVDCHPAPRGVQIWPLLAMTTRPAMPVLPPEIRTGFCGCPRSREFPPTVATSA
jgi:hypothetical protein